MQTGRHTNQAGAPVGLVDPVNRSAAVHSVAGIGDRLRALRLHAKLTQVDLGVALDVSRGHVAQIEAGRDLPGRDVMAAIARHFRVSLDWLSTGQGEIRPPRPLNEDEAALLRAYRRMPADEAKAHLEYMVKRSQAPKRAD